MTSHSGAAGAQVAEQAEAVAVGEVHVEQHQVDLAVAEHAGGLGRGVGDADDVEARDAAGVLRVRLRDERLVLDDQDPDAHDGTAALSGARRPTQYDDQLGAAELGPADRHPAAEAARDLRDEGEPHAVRVSGVGLRGPAALEGVGGLLGREPGSAVADDEPRVVGRALEVHDDAAIGGAGDGVDRVVDEVAEDGDEVARRADGERGRQLAGDGERDAALGGLRGLAEQQRRDDRVAHRADDAVGEHLGDLQLVGDEVDRLLGAPDLDEGDHGVQPVGGLVGLRPQRLGEAADDVELAGDGLQLGVVAQGDDRADLLAVPEGGAGAGDEDVVAGHVDLVGTALAGGRLDERRRQAEVVERAADDVVGQAEQPARLVVDELDPAVEVDEQQAFADGVQDGAVVLVHPGDLALAHAVGLAPQPLRDQPRPDDPDDQHHDRGDDDVGELVDAAGRRAGSG